MASTSAGWPAALEAACEGLVHPGLGNRAERERQKRLILVLFATPVFLGVAASLSIGAASASALFGMVAACFCLSWLGALAVIQTGRVRAVEAGHLALTALAIAVLVMSGGGASSPLMLLAVVPAAEAFMVARTSKAAQAGGVFGVGIAALVGMATAAGLPVGDPVWFQWLAPALYGATLMARVGPFRTEAASVATAAPLEALLPDAVIRFDRSGDVCDASLRTRGVLGVEPHHLLGSGLFERVHVADRVAWLCALADLRAGGLERTVEARIRVPSGAETMFGRFRIHLANAGGDTGEIVAFVRDLSEIDELRCALGAAGDVATGAEITKKRFLAAVSHELRTPLNAIIGFSDILLHEMFGGFENPRQREYVGLIQQSGNHLLGVVNSILDVSKIEAGAYAIEPEPFVFRDAVDMCHSMMAFQARSKSVRLINDVGHQTGEIAADRRAVQQMLINLVSNAVKFTPEGGEVRIGAGRMGSRLTFWVADTGIGIAESDLGRLGQPFAQVQNDYTRQFEGTGLGLSLVRGLVTLHEGDMSIESAPGQGTTVSISLPVAGPAASRPRDDEADGLGRHDVALRKTA